MGRGGRGQINTKQILFSKDLSESKDIDRNHPVLDEKPYLEKWYSLNDFVESETPAFVSVEAKPAHFEIEEDWNYRAMIHCPNWDRQREFEHQNFEGKSPEEAVRKAAEALGEIIIEPNLEEVEPNTIGLNPTVQKHAYLTSDYMPANHFDEVDDWRKNHIRLKPYPKPKQNGTIRWYSQEFCDSHDNGEGTDNDYHYIEDGLKQSAENPNNSTWEEIPTSFPTNKTPKEFYIVTKIQDTGDTFSKSTGRRERLFAFDTREAAEEYASYRYPELSASYFDSGTIAIIHHQDKPTRTKTLSFGNQL